jgi:hypothetical protein
MVYWWKHLLRTGNCCNPVSFFRFVVRPDLGSGRFASRLPRRTVHGFRLTTMHFDFLHFWAPAGGAAHLPGLCLAGFPL